MKRILLIGKNGQIGWELQRTLSSLGEVQAMDCSALDLTNPAQIRSVIQSYRPHALVNAGAYTAVDKAESDREHAMAVNAQGCAVLAEEASRWGFPLVHFSTDYIFDGRAATPYKEDDKTAPINAYGLTKLEGEKAVRESGCKHLIFRTSWIYAGRGKNFLLTMLNLAKSKSTISVVNDQKGAPTWARSVAEGAALALVQALYQENEDESPWGTYHMTCGGETSWHGFAEEIFAQIQTIDPEYPQPELKAIPAAEYPTPATRPAYSVLDNEKLNKTFHLALPHWKKALELCLQERTKL